MSDPTPPAPQPEPEAKRRRLSKKWVVGIVAGVVTALVLGGAAYGVKAKGDSRAEEHAKALNAWNDQKNDLLGAPSEANRVLWELYDDSTTKESLAKQKAACDDVVTLQKKAAKNAAAVPKESDSFFKLLSSAERDAIKDSKARVKAVKAYEKAASAVLEQLHRDCSWNIRTNSVKEGDSGAKKIFDEADSLMLKAGHSEGSYYCPSGKIDCIPVTAAKRERYAKLILKAVKVDKDYTTKKFFVPGQCDITSYAKLCDALQKNLESYYGSIEDYSDIFKAVAPSDSKLKSEYDDMKKDNKSADKAFKAELLKAHPTFKDTQVSEYPFWQEAYFDATAREAIAKLDKLRDAVLDLAVGSDSVDAQGPHSLRLS